MIPPRNLSARSESVCIGIFQGLPASFPPADIVAQILNFGLPAPFDLQIVGANTIANAQLANRLVDQISRIPGAVDVRVQQPFDSPRLNLVVDRTQASQLGITENQVAGSLLGALSGTSQTNPNFWLDPKNGVSYTVNTQSPQYSIDSLDALRDLPILGPTGTASDDRAFARSSDSNPRKPGANYSFFGTADRYALQYSARDRYLRRGRGQRPRIYRRKSSKGDGRRAERSTKRKSNGPARPGPNHERLFRRT